MNVKNFIKTIQYILLYIIIIYNYNSRLLRKSNEILKKVKRVKSLSIRSIYI